MLNVAVVDDEAAERERIRACLDYVAKVKNVEFCVDEYATADSFLIRFEHEYDIVFMDIEFPTGMDGMEAARALRRSDQTVVLIFITNMAQLAVQGYEVDAMDFIVKPIDQFSFLLKMTRVLSRVARNPADSISIKEDGELRSLRVHLIRYLMVDGHYVVYHSREGVFSEYISLSAAERKLNSSFFYRCDRGCLVNLRFVTQIKKETCIVDGQELVIARTQRVKFLKAYADYLSGINQVR